jgi:hypothetical protein
MRLAVSLSLSLLLPLLACGFDPEPVIPDVSGSYNLVAQQQDSDCLPEIADAEQIWGFMTEAASGIRVMTVEIAQQAGELEAELGPSGCLWSGVIDAAASLTLSGDCHDSDVARSAHLTALASPYASGWEWTGSMSVEIDTIDIEGNALPDGISDCVVHADIEGTGS